MGNHGGLGGRHAREGLPPAALASALVLALALSLTLAAAACSDGGNAVEYRPTAPGGAATSDAAPTVDGLRRCADDRHVVVFEVFGTLSMTDLDFDAWRADRQASPPPRPNFAALVTAYRDHGYEILYATTLPGAITVGDVPVTDAVVSWLALNSFPTGDGTSVWTWNSVGTPVIGIVDELVRLTNSGVSVDAGYTNNHDEARAMATGGIPYDTLYALGNGAPPPGARGLRDDMVVDHLTAVQALPDICRRG